MTTFNVDSLDFVDDEEVRTGANDDFATRFDSANDRLELEDLTNATTAFIPRGTSTDLVGGKFAETVSEGKALTDDGNVYDTIQGAVDNASSWVKVGPGDFNESLTIDTAGLTLKGSGNRTHIFSGSTVSTVILNNDNTALVDVAVSNYSIGRGVEVTSNQSQTLIQRVTSLESGDSGLNTEGETNILNCTVQNTENIGIHHIGRGVVANNKIENSASHGTLVDGDGIIVSGNIFMDVGEKGLNLRGNDIVAYGNIVNDSGDYGIQTQGNDCIVVNNRITTTVASPINDEGTGNLIQDNLTG